MPAPASESDTSPRAARGTALWLSGLTLLGFAVVAGLLVPWDWVPGGSVVPVTPEELFAPDQLERQQAYSRTQRQLGWVSLAVSLLVAAALGLTPLGARLMARLRGRWWWRVLLGSALVLLVGALATLPLRLRIRANAVEAGLSTQTLPEWLRDWSVNLAVGWVYAALVVLLVVGCARRWPRAWPAVLGAVGAALVVAGSWAYPLVVEPLFNDFEPLPDGELRSQVLAIAEDEGVEVSQVLVADASRRTTTLNAYVSGLGDTRRVVLYDTLVADAPREETLVVVAHELGHAKYHDVAVGTALAALGVGFGAGLLGLLVGTGPGTRLARGLTGGGPARPEVVPLVLVLLSLGTLLSAPVENTVSRALEARADRTSLVATDEAAFERMQLRLSARSLSDPEPPWLHQLWFGSHPTVVQRIGLARGVAQAQ
jgi:STE24 endopeptidase